MRDHGDGFPAAFAPHAFERFSRPDGGRTGQGASLGLSIVQAIAVAHGGRATIGAPSGGGADVWLSVPTSHRRLTRSPATLGSADAAGARRRG